MIRGSSGCPTRRSYAWVLGSLGVASPSQRLPPSGTIIGEMQPPADTDWVIEQARATGFDLCGVAAAEDLADPARLDEWLARG
jgi:hypothetical protein